MNKYKHLMSNTLIFAIATFGSKLLPFLMLRFYTAVMQTDEFGIQSLITSACNLILPMMYLSMGEAVIRFGIDKEFKKSDVFTTSVLTVLLGYAALLCMMPVLGLVSIIQPYLWLIYLYCLSSAMHTVTTQFARASGFVKLFAASGIATTVITVLMNILLLLHFRMGAEGYILSIITADAVVTVALVFILRLYRYFKPRKNNLETAKKMLRYSIPLVPTAVFWWVTSLSNRFFLSYMIDESAVGIYAVSQTLPNLITLVSAIFIQAWQLSAFTEYKSPEGEKFFSNVFKSYYILVFIATSGLILICRPVLLVLAAPAYGDAWRYTPFLVLAVAFSTLVTFLGTIYNAVRKNGMVMLTTFIGAGVNIALNWLLIPMDNPIGGPQGAAIATFASFLAVFLIRAIDSRRHIKISMQPLRVLLILALLLGQIAVSLSEVPYWGVWSALIFLLLVLFNLRYIWFMISRLFEMISGKKHKA
ncbi:MAG: polysaccharide biosynthesis C-terminal domain-containing protein [Oscillospiraceae bacterium]|nr:polysaccharide biosynthesis C-terminal domain-containing protein [Oscillospiraceae bacterium]